MVAEIKSVNELKDLVEKNRKQLGLSNGLGSDFFKIHKIIQPSTDGSKSAASKHGRTNIRDQAMKSEVQKLRDMLHKLETQNKNLLLQLKEKDLEIRRLKLQLQRQPLRQVSNPALAPRSSQPDIRTTSVAATTTATRKAPSYSAPLIKQQRIGNPTEPSAIRTKNKVSTSTRSLSTTTGRTTTVQPQRQQLRQTKTAAPKSTVSLKPDPTLVVKKVQAVPKNKPSSSRLKTPPRPPYPDMSDIEMKVQSLRENNAARKIQQGWRQHRKMMNEGASKEKQAVIAICSELKKHKIRKERLKYFLQEDHGGSFQLSKSESDRIGQEVQLAFECLLLEESNAKMTILK